MTLAFTTKQNGKETHAAGVWRTMGALVETGPGWKGCVGLWRLCMKLGEQTVHVLQLCISWAICLPNSVSSTAGE